MLTPDSDRTRTLEAQGLRWRHGERWILDGISLELRPGEIVGLLGPNGAGKTVTMSLIAGLLRPTSGRVMIDGIDVTPLPLYQRARRGLGYLPQERSVFTKLNAQNNAALSAVRRALRRHRPRSPSSRCTPC